MKSSYFGKYRVPAGQTVYVEAAENDRLKIGVVYYIPDDFEVITWVISFLVYFFRQKVHLKPILVAIIMVITICGVLVENKLLKLGILEPRSREPFAQIDQWRLLLIEIVGPWISR